MKKINVKTPLFLLVDSDENGSFPHSIEDSDGKIIFSVDRNNISITDAELLVKTINMFGQYVF